MNSGCGARSSPMRSLPSRRSALFGALLLNEHLTQQGMAGATVIFIALALVARKSSGAGEREEAREDQSAK
eukprot:scaffold1744_cov129-Isochrysis_galbana.AAC.6